LKNGILLGKIKGIYRNLHFVKLGIETVLQWFFFLITNKNPIQFQMGIQEKSQFLACFGMASQGLNVFKYSTIGTSDVHQIGFSWY